jgi:cell division septation protein DedD
MMLTFRAVKFAALMVSVAVLGACSREQQDWRSAEASDTVEGYGEFLHRHPDSELATEARTRVAQLSEDREWQQAGNADTADAYKQFLAQHPNGKWAQEARIRMENFALGREGAAAGAGVSAAAPAEGLAASSDGTVGSGGVVGSGAGPAASLSGTVGSGAGRATSSGGAVGSGDTAGSGGTPPPASWGGTASSSGAAGPAAGAAIGAGGSAAQAYPGEPARAPTSAQTLPSAAASGSSGALAEAAGPTQASPAISNAWRSDDGFGVQFGAFTSEIAATSEWQQLTARFSAQLRGLAPRVVSANTSTGRLFRLQALVADEAAARALCDVLKKQSQACVPVLPH